MFKQRSIGTILFLLCSLSVFALYAENNLAQEADIQALKTRIDTFESRQQWREMLRDSLALQLKVKQEGSVTDQIYALTAIGTAYGNLGDSDAALTAFDSAMNLLQPDVDSYTKGRLFVAMARLLFEIQRYEETLDLISSALNSLALTDHPVLLASLYHTRTAAIVAMKEYEEALASAQNALSYISVESAPHLFGKVHNNIGMIYKDLNQYLKALDKFHYVHDIAESNDDEFLRVYALLELGDINRILGHYESAEEYLEQALSSAMSSDTALPIMYSHQYLAQYYRDMNDPGSARHHDQQAEIFKQKIFSEKAANRATVLQIKAEVMERDNAIALLEKDKLLQRAEIKEKQTIILSTAVVAIIISLALFLTIWLYLGKKKANQELDRLASIDHLTKLYNRHFLMGEVTNLEEKRKSDKGEVGIILIDIDHFKRINDQYGHDHGDAVLIEISRRLKDQLRESDTLGRWGGEEFIVLLPSTEKSSAFKIAEKLRQAIKQSPIVFSEKEHQVTATMGVTAFTDDTTFDQALKAADEALYEGKQSGRDKAILV